MAEIRTAFAHGRARTFELAKVVYAAEAFCFSGNGLNWRGPGNFHFVKEGETLSAIGEVLLTSSPTDPNPVDLTTPDNQRLVTRVLGISY